MKTYVIAILTSLLIGASALWLAWNRADATRATQVAATAMRAERDKLVREIARMPKPTPTPPPRSTQGTNAAAGTGAAGATTLIQPVAIAARPPVDRPLTREKVLQAKQAEFEMAYGPFVRLAKLDPATTARLIDVKMKHEEMQRELNAIRASPRSDRDAVEAFRKKITGEQQAALREVLGESGLRELQEYERAQPIRAWVMDFAGTAAYAAEPLTLPQAEQLTVALARGSPAYRDGGTVDPRGIDWDAVDEFAARILSPSQFELYRTADPLTARLVVSRAQDRLRQVMERLTGVSNPPSGARSPN